jgi:hypothetical protein
MIVDPNAPIPNLRSPYDPEEDENDDEDELPEITINATTQIRGHGNIISVPPMDAVRIAGLLHTMMYGPPGQTNSAGPRTRISPPKINITVNCGATVFGDRNVVGPGLEGIARQMQTARNQAHQASQQQQQQQSTKLGAQPSQTIASPVQLASPMTPRSRTPSEGGDSDTIVRSNKRKAVEEDVVEGRKESRRRVS